MQFMFSNKDPFTNPASIETGDEKLEQGGIRSDFMIRAKFEFRNKI